MSDLLSGPTPESIRLAWCAMVLERQLVMEQTGVFIVTGGPDDGKPLLPPNGLVFGKGGVQVNYRVLKAALGIGSGGVGGGASLGARPESQ